MRLGVLVRADSSGLGTQTQDWVRHLDPVKVLVVDMGSLCALKPDWKRVPCDNGLLMRMETDTPEQLHERVREWLVGLDAALSAETTYVPEFTRLAAAQGVKVAVAPNPEFASIIQTAAWLPVPDLLLAPTTWQIDRIPGAIHLPQGVDRARFRFRHRTEARTFLHVAGRIAAHDRNGTQIFLQALAHMTEPCRAVIYTQEPMYRPSVANVVDLEIRTGDVADNVELYHDGDVLVMPRRWGGQCLPAIEALSCGLPVLMPDCPPNNTILPNPMRLPCTRTGEWYGPSGPIDLYDANPRHLAERLDLLVRDPDEVALLSRFADQLAAGYDWQVMAPRWRAELERVCGEKAA